MRSIVLHAERFNATRGAFEHLGKPKEHLDAWKAIAAWQAWKNPWVDGGAVARDSSGGR